MNAAQDALNELDNCHCRNHPAHLAVSELIDIVHWLAASLLPGTHKPFTAPAMSAEKRAETDRRNREITGTGRQIGTTTMIPLGESPAPMDLNVLDLLVEILTTADELADLVSDTALVARMPSAPSAFTDPEPYLLHVLDLLPACKNDHTPAFIVKQCETVVFRARSMLGLIVDGQLLPMMCPWCGGRTSKHLFGGAKTLRIRLVPTVNPKTGKDEQLPCVVCESTLCQPPEEDFGRTHRGRPAWPLDAEGDWLARRIAIATQRVSEETLTIDAVVAGLAS